MLLYVLQCSIGSWVYPTPAERTGAQGLLLTIMGATIFILASVKKGLGIVSADRNKLVWSAFLFVSPSFSAIQKLKESIAWLSWRCMCSGVMTEQRRFGGVQEDAKGEHMALLCQWWGI